MNSFRRFIVFKLIFLLKLNYGHCAERGPNTILLKNTTNRQSIHHLETSSHSSFESLNERLKLSVHSLGVEYGRELRPLSTKISLTPFAQGGLIWGVSNEEALVGAYRVSIHDSYFYSFGTTLNFNVNSYPLKIQAFMGIELKSSHYGVKSQYEINEMNQKFILRYKNKLDQTNIMVGARFFDFRNIMMSYFSLIHELNNKQKLTLKSAKNKNQESISISSPATKLRVRNLSFAIGGGFSF